MDVILDLHWVNDTAKQASISDAQSPTFWASVANKYKTEGRVLFELYNEPFCDAATWSTAMQGLYNAVRTTAGAKNLVLIGGLDWAYKLSDVLPSKALSGTNIVYVTHPYQHKSTNPADWDAAFGNLAATYPIIATEFGQANINMPSGGLGCDGAFYTSLINYFNTKGIGWTAWAWYVNRAITDPAQTCGFPQVISGYNGTANAAGNSIKAALGN
jgi:hypothetical protein